MSRPHLNFERTLPFAIQKENPDVRFYLRLEYKSIEGKIEEYLEFVYKICVNAYM